MTWLLLQWLPNKLGKSNSWFLVMPMMNLLLYCCFIFMSGSDQCIFFKFRYSILIPSPVAFIPPKSDVVFYRTDIVSLSPFDLKNWNSSFNSYFELLFKLEFSNGSKFLITESRLLMASFLSFPILSDSIFSCSALKFFWSSISFFLYFILWWFVVFSLVTYL
jgi:hypothetical protein